MWIVVCPGIWSRDDVQSIIYAMRVAETLDGKLHLGIRPFHRYEDVCRWYGDENTRKTESPVWVGTCLPVRRNGHGDLSEIS